MSPTQPKSDSRLLGTWQSDRRRTFRHWKPKPGCRPVALRRFKAMFGELVVRWTRKRCYSELGEFRSADPYEVVARDSSSVVIRVWDEFVEEYRVRQIHFEGEDRYWITVSPNLSECFRRVG